jgi:hypothetical protein
MEYLLALKWRRKKSGPCQVLRGPRRVVSSCWTAWKSCTYEHDPYILLNQIPRPWNEEISDSWSQIVGLPGFTMFNFRAGTVRQWSPFTWSHAWITGKLVLRRKPKAQWMWASPSSMKWW